MEIQVSRLLLQVERFAKTYILCSSCCVLRFYENLPELLWLEKLLSRLIGRQSLTFQSFIFRLFIVLIIENHLKKICVLLCLKTTNKATRQNRMAIVGGGGRCVCRCGWGDLGVHVFVSENSMTVVCQRAGCLFTFQLVMRSSTDSMLSCTI